MSATYQVQGDVAVISLSNPPVNGLGHATRAGVVDGIRQAQADGAVRAIVIAGSGKVFSGGADIREFNTPKATASPTLHEVIAALEACTKPVVAAVHGVAMGGGLELALGAHYRVVAPGAQIALPEVKLGIVPGAGGTQRLPRVLGVETALRMITTGEPVKSEVLAQAPGQQLFSRVIEGDLLAGALAFAREVADARPLPSVRQLSAAAPADAAFFAQAKAQLAKTARGLTAPQRCVDCVEAATRLSLDDGLAYEREAFTQLVAGVESKALRHAFFGERAAAKIPDVADDTPLRPVERVAVIGAGTMGGGIAMNFLNAGIPVTMLETQQAALDRGLGVIRKNYEAQVAKGKLAQAKYEQRMSLLTPTLNVADIAQADMVIEAVFEDLGVKESVFKQLDATVKPGAILASNTSTLDLNQIAAFTRRPQDVVGLHFFSPANVMRLLEVVRGAKTAPDVLATVMQLAKKIKKLAVVAGVCDGFIGNRMIEQYSRQAGFLLDEGASPEQVDRAIEKWGMAMGPFRMGDLAGNDIGWAIRKRRYVEKPAVRYSKTADLLCEQGRFGQKTGAGWYDYEPGQREPKPSALVSEMLVAHRKSLGITPRAISDDEIVGRLVWSLVNEGARILEEGIAQRASDIDMIYLSGYGFPLFRGGPMFYADTVGLPAVVDAMKTYQRNPHDDASFWEPAALLAQLAAQGKTFN
ncbi:3-hydroxyacyl-CoA dehydrogenase NAD-binding domain-containing protein [Aquabacterium sp.]|uniref:3-hydroxyacyl-CoA dehydrogenase NAD-binding domain-containing protein n=1 Tax=Aquabacterium sp. TaxID=1872578 RepID=UPI0035B0CA6B